MTAFKTGGGLHPEEHSYIIVHRLELDRIVHHIEKDDLYIVLNSPHQTGKTTLLYQILFRLHGHGYGAVYLDLHGLSNLAEAAFYQTICADIRDQLADLIDAPDAAVDFQGVVDGIGFSDFLTRLSTHTPHARKLLIMLDEIEGVPEGVSSPCFSSLRRFFHRGRRPSRERNTYRKVTFIFTCASTLGLQRLSPGPNSPLRNVCKSFFLDDFSREQVHGLASHLTGYSDECVATIADSVHRWCDGHPYLTQCLYTLIDESEACRAASVERLPGAVDGLVESAFLYGDDANLVHIFNHLRENDEYHEPVSSIFEGGRKSTILAEDLISLGIIKRSADNNLIIRNKIYETKLKAFFNDIGMKGDDSMTEILTGILANGLYDIIKRGAGRFRASSKLSDRIREIQWERLYEDADLQKQIDLYRSRRSQEALIGLGAAVQTVLEKDADLAAGMQELLSDKEAAGEVVSLAEAEPSRAAPSQEADGTQQAGARLSSDDRLAVIQQLNRLPSQPFNMLILALNPPPGQVPPPTAAQGDRVFALLNWAEGTGGCGLPQVQGIMEAIVNPQ